jgi:hypothetical protein
MNRDRGYIVLGSKVKALRAKAGKTINELVEGPIIVDGKPRTIHARTWIEVEKSDGSRRFDLSTIKFISQQLGVAPSEILLLDPPVRSQDLHTFLNYGPGAWHLISTTAESYGFVLLSQNDCREFLLIHNERQFVEGHISPGVVEKIAKKVMKMPHSDEPLRAFSIKFEGKLHFYSWLDESFKYISQSLSEGERHGWFEVANRVREQYIRDIREENRENSISHQELLSNAMLSWGSVVDFVEAKSHGIRWWRGLSFLVKTGGIDPRVANAIRKLYQIRTEIIDDLDMWGYLRRSCDRFSVMHFSEMFIRYCALVQQSPNPLVRAVESSQEK